MAFNVFDLLSLHDPWEMELKRLLEKHGKKPLRELRDIILEAKVGYTENYNHTYKTRRIIPEALPVEDIEIILLYKYQFRRILTFETKKSDNALLGIYIESGPDRGVYDTSRHTIYELIKECERKTTKKQHEEILHGFSTLVPLATLTQEPHWIVCNNGIFDKKSGKLMDFDPKYVYISKAATDYNPNAKNPIITLRDGSYWDVDSWLFEVADENQDIYDLLWEVASDFIQSGFNREKVPILYGKDGRNGKGTYGTLLEEIIGRERIANLSIADFKEEFLKEQLLGAVGVIAHENDVDGYIDSMKDFKAIATEDTITINRKYEKPINFKFKGTIIQMMNGLPRIKDKSGSLYRRLLIVPFNRHFEHDDAKKDIKDVLIKRQDVREYVLYRCCHLNFTNFTEPSQSRELLAEYKEMNDPIRQFWNELSELFVWDLLPSTFVYDLYKNWFQENNPNGKVVGKIAFLDDLRTLIQEEDLWIDNTRINMKTSSKMDADEPLITEYNLQNWMDRTYRGTDLKKMREFSRKTYYRGFVRKD